MDGKGNKAGPKQAPPVVDPATGEVKEPPKDERSFLQKNWMLILPAGFLVSPHQALMLHARSCMADSRAWPVLLLLLLLTEACDQCASWDMAAACQLAGC